MKKTVMIIAVSVLAALTYLLVTAPEAQAQDRGNRRSQFERMSPDEMAERMKQFRSRMLDMVREQLGFSEEDWSAVEPLYVKVTELQRQLVGNRGFGRGGQRGGMGGRGEMGRGGGRGGDEAGGRGERRPDPFAASGMQRDELLVKATEQLNTTLADENASPEAIAKSLAAFRLARDEVEKKLEQARSELKEVLTARQEAQLVANGTLR